jgi:hypothetical protein
LISFQFALFRENRQRDFEYKMKREFPQQCNCSGGLL